MSLQHAILAVLSHGQRTGYELVRKMDGSVANFWPATHQQIYAELKRLTKRKRVTFKAKTQQGKPDKKIYSITQLGLAELTQWLAQPIARTPSKDALLIKIFASHLRSKNSMVVELAKHQEQHTAKLIEYRMIEKSHFLAKKKPPRLMAQYFTLQRGILFEEAWLQWCEKCLKYFDT